MVRLQSSIFDPTPSTTAEQKRTEDNPAMLQLVQTNGSQTAFGYSYLYRVDFNGTDEIRLHFMHDVVTLTGQRLQPLIDELLAHDLQRIVQQDPLQIESPEKPAVFSIHVEPSSR